MHDTDIWQHWGCSIQFIGAISSWKVKNFDIMYFISIINSSQVNYKF